jgi:DNA repair exonuclease SbcCD ATPase subunit
MHRFESYSNLRANARESNLEITLWPSFTDIMTVILMIFMLTMIVVIFKNSNLAQALLHSEDRVQKAESLLRENQVTQEELKINLTKSEEKLREKEMQIILLSDETKMLQKSLENKSSGVAALETEVADLKKNVLALEETVKAKEEEALNARQQARSAKETLDAQLTEMTKRYEAKFADLQATSEKKLAEASEENQRKIQEYNQRILSLLNQLDEKQAAVVTVSNEKQDLELSLAKQRQEYSTLEEKYIKLIRPARSPEGKQVVAIQYSRKDGEYHILFKGVDADQFEPLSMDQLQQRLEALKKRWGENLYVKIIIPEDSGLSYNEAWTFTKDILSRYDYYYQE